jgi:hypothetical protein
MSAQDSNARKYGIVGKIEELDPRQIDAYWRRVAESLQHVFGMSISEAESKVDRLRGNLKEAGRDTEFHFYHSDPFQIASDLAGAAGRRITPDEKRRYIDLQNLPEDDRPDSNSLERLLPEDLHRRD